MRIKEARVGLDLEARGVLRPPITRYPGEAAEFLDGDKVPWDVKGRAAAALGTVGRLHVGAPRTAAYGSIQG